MQKVFGDIIWKGPGIALVLLQYIMSSNNVFIEDKIRILDRH